jgi:hypothetical protein
MSQMNPIHNFLTYLSTIYSNVILPSTPKSYDWPLSFSFPDLGPSKEYVQIQGPV